MFIKVSELTSMTVHARDGPVGTLHDVLFEDDSWRVRWVVVDSGSWLPGRRVLLPATHLRHPSREAMTVSVDLDTGEVEGAPSAETDLPVSRRLENEIYRHYGWAPYWPVTTGSAFPPPLAGGAGAWAAVSRSGVRPRLSDAVRSADPSAEDHHLRSAREVTGYYIRAKDDDIGHVEDLVVSAADWTLPFLIVDTRNWWPGRHVLVPTGAIERIAWSERLVRLDRTRQEIQESPEYDVLGTAAVD